MPQLSDPRRVSRRRLHALASHIPLARAGDVESVHQARVASRRLRELLPLLEPVPGRDRAWSKVARRVRALTRALGPVRELDVALLALDDLGTRRPDDLVAVALVRTAVQQARVPAMDHLVATLEHAGMDKIRERVLDASAAFASPAARWTLAATLSARIERRAAAARLAIEDAGTVYAQDRLHGVRIALKKLRYTLELAEDVGGFRLSGTLGRLKTIQDVLGVLHDDVVLAARVRDCAAAGADGDARTALAACATHLDEETRLRHVEFLRARPALDVVFGWAGRVGLALAAPGARAGGTGRIPSAAARASDV